MPDFKLLRSFEQDLLKTPDPILASRTSTRWDNLTLMQQVNVTIHISEYRTLKKSLRDALHARETGLQYRGHIDDDGKTWRPRFECYIERGREVLETMVKLRHQVNTLLHFYLRRVGGEDEIVKALREEYQQNKKRVVRWKRKAVDKDEEIRADVRVRAEEVRWEGVGVDVVDLFPVTEGEAWTESGEGEGDADVSGKDRKWFESWPPLGKGGFGEATLYVQRNSAGRIEDRVVRKVINGGALWESPKWWTDGVGSVPIEVQAHRVLAGKVGSSSIVGLRKWSMTFGSEVVLYLEYCAYGDLSHLLSDKYHAKEQPRHEDKLSNLVAKCKFLPEPFLWHVFLNLAIAGMLMERGDLEQPYEDDWSLIVHRDLKLSNILLGSYSVDRFCGYPEPKVADFGLALMIDPSNAHDTVSFGINGTFRHQAPEQVHLLKASDERGKIRTRPMTTKTNVWGVGMVMWSLIAGREGPLYYEFDLRSKPDTHEPPEFDASAQAFFGKELQDLVQSCLRYDPDDRPPFDTIIAQIQKHTSGGAEERASNMRKLAAGDAKAWEKHKIPLAKFRDEYAVGMTRHVEKPADKETRESEDTSSIEQDLISREL